VCSIIISILTNFYICSIQRYLTWNRSGQMPLPYSLRCLNGSASWCCICNGGRSSAATPWIDVMVPWASQRAGLYAPLKQNSAASLGAPRAKFFAEREGRQRNIAAVCFWAFSGRPRNTDLYASLKNRSAASLGAPRAKFFAEREGRPRNIAAVCFWAFSGRPCGAGQKTGCVCNILLLFPFRVVKGKANFIKGQDYELRTYREFLVLVA